MYVFCIEAGGFHPEMEIRGDIRAMIGRKRNHEKKRWIKKRHEIDPISKGRGRRSRLTVNSFQDVAYRATKARLSHVW